MQFFGKAHRDSHDAGAALTCMTVMSDLPLNDGDESGRLTFPGYGISMPLVPGSTLLFCGRLPHGGTAPISAPGTIAPAWAYRVGVITYPSRPFMEGTCRHSFASLPHRAEPVYMSPELTGVL